ncbi:unnamed protein product [marine sediment metagenome]|uniref:Uncharacterized protein n=1 Tax=marine sediment metagenome TaxID=412755 RepID=X1E2H6_9ZZZZ
MSEEIREEYWAGVWRDVMATRQEIIEERKKKYGCEECWDWSPDISHFHLRPFL